MYTEKERITGKENLVKAAAIQISYTMGEKEANIQKGIDKISEAVANGAKLVVLPECSTTGYVFNTRQEAASLAEEVPCGPTVKLWEKVAAEKDVYIVAGIVEKEDVDLYNTAVLVGPEGYIGKYRKMHLWDEDKLWYEPGNLGIPVFHTPIGKIAILICYDMWFSEMWRICALKGADIVCVPTNWLVIDTLPKDVLTMAPYMAMVAANTNDMFVVCADRVGYERGITFPGKSLIVGPSGIPSAQASWDQDEIIYADCNMAAARDFNWASHVVLFRDRRCDYYDEMLGTDEKKCPM